jgi:hypothetical protein
MSDRKFVLVPYNRREALSVQEAAGLAGRSASTLRNWCEKYPIARKVAGGNWQVSRVALQMLLEDDMKALAAYNAGERELPRVAAYFRRFGLDIAALRAIADEPLDRSPAEGAGEARQ